MKINLNSPERPARALPVKDLPMFFIIGRPRSGTTLLRTIFDVHPNVSIPLECRLISSLYSKYHWVKKWNKELLEKFYADVLSLPKIDIWTLDKENLRANILNADENISFANLVKYVYVNYVSFFEKDEIRLIGDKTPYYSLDTPTLKVILGQFPDVKIIHIVRDYRDNYLSMRKVDFEGNYISLVCFRWKFSFRMVRELMKKKSSQYYYLRYEDLVTNPGKEVKKICKFLSIEYHEEMLHYYMAKDKILEVYSMEEIVKYHSSLLKPIIAENIYGWKKKLPDKKVEFADAIVGKHAEEAGYERKFRKSKAVYKLMVLPDVIYIHLWFLYEKIYGIFFPNSLRKEMPIMVKLFFAFQRKRK